MWVYKSQLVLTPNSGSFPMWQDLPAPLTARIFLFNVTNPDQVNNYKNPQYDVAYGLAKVTIGGKGYGYLLLRFGYGLVGVFMLDIKLFLKTVPWFSSKPSNS